MEETGLRTLAYEEALAYTRGITVDELRAGYAKQLRFHWDVAVNYMRLLI
jgi:hypothetical protein